VLLTDHDQDVLQLLYRNAKLALADSVAASAVSASVAAESAGDEAQQETLPDPVKYELLDCAGVEWGRADQPTDPLFSPIPDEWYNAIVATDVVYGDGEFIVPLIETAFDKLAAGGTCYLANHSVRFNVLERQLLDAAAAVGFQVTRMPALPTLAELAEQQSGNDSAGSGAAPSEADDNIDLQKLAEYIQVKSKEMAGKDLGPVQFLLLHKPAKA
jgi:hypothetical protein